jgi:hypothetical protein
MGAGFKKLPFDWRGRALSELRGANLAVWLYHYWRSDRENQVEAANQQIADETRLAKTTVKVSKRWLKANGWLVVNQEAYRDEETGQWIVPVIRATYPGLETSPGDEFQGAKDALDRGVKLAPGSRAKNTAWGQGVKDAPSVDTDFSSVNTTHSDADASSVDTEEESAASSSPAGFESDSTYGLPELIAVAESYGLNGKATEASLNLIPLLEKHCLEPADLPRVIAAARANPDPFMANRIRTWKGLLSCLDKGGIIDQWRSPLGKPKGKRRTSVTDGITSLDGKHFHYKPSAGDDCEHNINLGEACVSCGRANGSYYRDGELNLMVPSKIIEIDEL